MSGLSAFSGAGPASPAVAVLPPALNIPDSVNTVDVRVIDTNTLIYIKAEFFWQPPVPGFDGVNAPIYCFLVSHGEDHYLFDLGVRKDWENYPPSVVAKIKFGTVITPGLNVAEVLDQDTSGLNIRSADIKGVIWSHNHYDHTGDVSTFPSTTELVVGPGVKELSWPGFPTNPLGEVLDSDAAGRDVREISFDQGLKIGQFDSHDFFGDGSFYLLDAPGHSVGHIGGLARVTSDPPSFVFMGADSCHHAGVLRPSNYLPLPSSGSNSTCRPSTGAQCPGHLLQDDHSPFFTLANNLLFPDYEKSTETVGKIQELDAAENILVLLAHDLTLLDKIPLFPEDINGWQQTGVKEATRWIFCEDLTPKNETSTT